MTGRELMHTSWNMGNTDLILKKTLSCKSGQILEQVAQRQCGISILGGGTSKQGIEVDDLQKSLPI